LADGDFTHDDPDGVPDMLLIQEWNSNGKRYYAHEPEFKHYQDMYGLNARLTTMSWFSPAHEPEHELLRELRLKDMECGGDREMYNTHVAL